MVVDHIANLNRYVLPHIKKIEAFLENNKAIDVPDGEHEIDGRNLFVRVMSNHLKPIQENKFETHRIYADVQYVVQGIELMQVVSSDQLKPATDYDTAGDYQFFTAERFISDLVVREGQFTIFYPGQAHRPSCIYQNQTPPIKKLVFKVKIH